MKTLSVLFMSVMLFAGCTVPPCECKEATSDSTKVVADTTVKIDSVKVDTTVK